MFKKRREFQIHLQCTEWPAGGGSEEKSVWSEGQQQLQLKDRLQEHHISHSVSSYMPSKMYRCFAFECYTVKFGGSSATILAHYSMQAGYQSSLEVAEYMS